MESNNQAKNRDSSPETTVEELLRVKRHERPDPEFWDGFQAELRRRTLESVAVESGDEGRWRRHLLRWFVPAFSLGAVAATFLFFFGPKEWVETDPKGTGEAARAAPAQVEESAPIVSLEVAESRGAEFANGAIELSVEEEVDGVKTEYLGKSLRYEFTEEVIFEDAAYTLLPSQTDEPARPVTF